MKNLTLAFGILLSCVSVGICDDEHYISNGKGAELRVACIDKDNKNACNTLIRNAKLAKVDECSHHIPEEPNVINHFSLIGTGINLLLGNKSCFFIAKIYYGADYFHEAKPYFEKLCKSNDVYSCGHLADMHILGKGTRQDYFKAVEFYQKACNMKIAKNEDNKESLIMQGASCNNLGARYENGQGVKQNLYTAKQYYGKACDLGLQKGCDNYTALNEQGVQ